jgi:hypothetical protein
MARVPSPERLVRFYRAFGAVPVGEILDADTPYPQTWYAIPEA